jgi:hypothetical protein
MDLRRLLALASLAAVAVVACSDATGGGGQPQAPADSGVARDGGTMPPGIGTGPDGTCGGFMSSNATCNGCFTANCCLEGTNCANDSACTQLFSCLKACTTQACADGCNSMFSSGAAHLNAFVSCVDANCAAECGPAGDAGSSDAAPTDAGMCGGYGSSNPTCNTCLDTSCCTQAFGCGANAQCNALFACTQACAQGDQACLNACSQQFPSGVSAYDAFVGCMNTSCAGKCGGPTDAAVGGGGG